ncbi:MAG: SDR family oxidoreductase [Chthoniobacteraceae bacterium]
MSVDAAAAASPHAGRAGPAAGRVAIVTGAAGDIGRAIVRRFLEEGGRVAAADIDAARLEAAFGGDAATRERVLRIACDIADADACRDAVAATVRRFGALDRLVNNAAIVTPAATPADLSVEDWERALKVNLTAAFLFCKWSIPHMKARNGGVVINIASQLGHVAAPGRSSLQRDQGGAAGADAVDRDRPRGGRHPRGQRFARLGDDQQADRPRRLGGRRARAARPAASRRASRHARRGGRVGPVPRQRRRGLHHRQRPAGGRRLHGALIRRDGARVDGTVQRTTAPYNVQ